MIIEGKDNKDVKKLVKSIKSNGSELENYIDSITDKKINFDNKNKLITENIKIVFMHNEMYNSNSETYVNSRNIYER